MMKVSLHRQPKLTHWPFIEDSTYALIYQKHLKQWEDIFQDIKAEKFSLARFNTFVVEFGQSMMVHPWGLFRVFYSGNYQPSIASSCLNTALVTYIFARTFHWSDKKMQEITRAALLHDVGMLFIPQEILTKEGSLNELERKLIESHPFKSFDFVKNIGEVYEVTQVALQHHEEYSGIGYPQKLMDDKIHPWTLIVSVALNFVARVTERAYRSSLIGYLAQKQLIKEQKKRFSPKIVKDFIRAFGLFPPGSILLLSDGSVARVIENATQAPLYPKVRILIDKEGKEYRNDCGLVLDLAKDSKIFVARPVNFQDVLDACVER